MHTCWGHPLNLHCKAHAHVLGASTESTLQGHMHTYWGHPLNLHCKGTCTRTGDILPKRLFCCRRSPRLIEAVEGEARRPQRRWTRLEEVPLPRQSAAHSRWAPESAQGCRMCSMHRPVCTHARGSAEHLHSHAHGAATHVCAWLREAHVFQSPHADTAARHHGMRVASATTWLALQHARMTRPTYA
jgi:hypothetical protein